MDGSNLITKDSRAFSSASSSSTSGAVAPERGNKLRRVLVATDFSTYAREAVTRAAKLPLAGGASVQLLHVVPSGDQRSEDLRRDRDHIEFERERLDTLIEPKPTAKIVVGDAWSEIVRAARAQRAELVVLGAHSKRGRRLKLGSTARDVVRRGSSPVLVVRGRASRPYQRPLVALDLSDVSKSVLDLALLVVDDDVPLQLVHAYHVPFEGYVSTSSSRSELESFRRHYRNEARARMSAFVATLEQGSSRYAESVRQGEACRVVAQEIAQRKSDLLVVGTHGRMGLSHFFLGSVAQWMLENAPCDVLVGRPEPFPLESI